MTAIRALVVDDSVVMRQLIRQALESDPHIKVQAVAANGRIALSLISRDMPDVVILDIEMPEMDGLACLRALRTAYPRLPVIMCSTLTEHGASITVEALSLGASDYVLKPSSISGPQNPLAQLQVALVPKIRALCGVRSATHKSMASAVGPTIRCNGGLVTLVVIGCSTGGPNALADVIPTLPAEFPAPVLIVQHMPPMFTRLMAERLNKISQIPVAEASAGIPLASGKAWVAAGDFHLLLAETQKGAILQLSKTPPVNSCRPAVDILFQSAAKTHSVGVLGVVLTGMGQDGLRGAEAIRGSGGRVIVQDETSSVVWGMPGAIATAGLATAILPLTAIGQAIVAATQRTPIHSNSTQF
jgi:two-component system, chemotaxis family, protein-glutamate methylesterase/glutaminase